jgi:hypothetical protein
MFDNPATSYCPQTGTSEASPYCLAQRNPGHCVASLDTITLPDPEERKSTVLLVEDEVITRMAASHYLQECRCAEPCQKLRRWNGARITTDETIVLICWLQGNVAKVFAISRPKPDGTE